MELKDNISIKDSHEIQCISLDKKKLEMELDDKLRLYIEERKQYYKKCLKDLCELWDCDSRDCDCYSCPIRPLLCAWLGEKEE